MTTSAKTSVDNAPFLNKILSALPLLIAYLDRDFNFLYINDTYEKWFGISKERCLASNVCNIIGATGVAKVRHYLDLVLEGKAQDFETILPYKGGVTRSVHVRCLPDCGNSGEVKGIIVLVEDLTERNVTQSQFPTADLEIASRSEVINSTIASWVSNTDPKTGLVYSTGNDLIEQKAKDVRSREIIKALDQSAIVAFTDTRGKITYVNDLFCVISGYSRQELLGKDHRILNSGKMGKEFFKQMWSTIKSGNLWNGRICNRAKNGSLYWVDTTICPLVDDSGTIRQYIAIRKDITNEMNQQQELKAAYEKAEKAALAKSEFLATMSHEIRTPLNGVIGMSEMLLEQTLSQDQYEIARTISNSGKTLLTIINDILDFSKIEAGKLQIENIEFDLSSYLIDLVKPYSFTAEKKGLKFETQIPQLSGNIIGDPGRIGQIVNNLIANAFKFTETGGISFELKASNEAEFAKIRFLVKDTGIGIPDDAKSRMFQAFSQAEYSTSRQYGGTGLGLSICKRLVDMMKGKITFESQAGVGTTFIVDLKLKLGKETSRFRSQSRAGDISNASQLVGRVLVAEDNQTNQIVIGRMLEKMGLQFHFVANGNEALDSLRDSPFDLILMDCEMPEMDGFTATKIIRKSKTLPSQIPIIALTAHAIQGEEQKCLEAGMNAYVSKPIDRRILRRRLSKFLKERLSLDQPMIDLQALSQFNELQMDGYPDILVETIDSFIKTSPVRIMAIQGAVSEAKWIDVANSAHALKSSALTLGAKQLGYLCEKFETLAPVESERRSLLRLVKVLVQIHAHSCQELRQIKQDRVNVLRPPTV